LIFFVEENMPEYQFVMRTGPFAGKVYPISGDVVTLGREPGNSIVINDAEISRRHTRLVLQGDVYMVEDLGSTNGTFVNGVRLTGPHALNGGEVISFGEQISCVFEVLGGDPNATVMHSPRTEVAAPTLQPQKPVYVPPSVQSVPPPRTVPPAEPSFARQIPAGPEPVPPALPKKNNTRVIIIIALVLVLCIFCACIGFFWWVDSDPTGSRWCSFFPFIVTGLGGVCP
jgi:hypothetical protein